MDYSKKLDELLLTTARQNASDLHLRINRNFITKLLLFTAIFLNGFIFFINSIDAEEVLNIPGTIEAEGVHFAIIDSQYLNVILDSSEPIKLRMESIPEMLTMMIEASSSTTTASTQIVLSGLAPLTKYYKYQDDYRNLEELITDENGVFSFIQDISSSHLIFIQPRHSTKLIRDNATGGDCYLIGNWDNSAKTCILTMDLNEGIWFGSDGIFLDGNGHTITGSNTGIGIDLSNYPYGRRGVTVKNLNIKNFSYGIFLFYTSDSNNFFNNTISNNYRGTAGTFNKYNNFSNNTFSNNNYGLELSYVNYYQIYNNNFINNSIQAYVEYYWPYWQTNNFSGNYWSNYDTPQEGCSDINSDNICDSSYYFYRGQDNYPWKKQDGWENQPPVISNFNQYKSDGTTIISESEITTEDAVVFKANISDPDGDDVKLQVEIRQFNEPFTGIDDGGILNSNFVNSGSEASITRYSLIPAPYHWRVRAVDSKGRISDWQEFRTEGNVDFIVKILEQAAADLAKQLVNSVYLLGGKGWDYNISEFVAPNIIKTGYNFYNASTTSFDFGAGVDCSGLVMWSYNRSYDALKSRFNNFIKAEGADEQYRENTITTTESQLQPGDVMFFDNLPKDGYIDHVAMYVGESGGYDVVSAASPLQGIVPVSKNDLKQLPKFVAFKQVILALPPAVLATAYSPVDLILTDPDGFTITPTTTISSDLEYLREISGVFYYSEMEKGVDGNPIDQIYSYTAKAGDYIIKVIPATGAFPTETYTLDFKVGEQTTVLAQDVSLSQIPNQGYGITVSATGTTNLFIPVVIDIKPNSYPNSINLGSNGNVSVAIFGSATFDVSQIDTSTIILANAGIKLKGNGQSMASYQDVNSDGFIDIVVHIITDALQLTETDEKAELNGFLLDGRNIKGTDSIKVVP